MKVPLKNGITWRGPAFKSQMRICSFSGNCRYQRHRPSWCPCKATSFKLKTLNIFCNNDTIDKASRTDKHEFNDLMIFFSFFFFLRNTVTLSFVTCVTEEEMPCHALLKNPGHLTWVFLFTRDWKVRQWIVAAEIAVQLEKKHHCISHC